MANVAGAGGGGFWNKPVPATSPKAQLKDPLLSLSPSVTPAPNQRSDQAKAQLTAIQQKGKGGVGGFVSEWTGPSLEHLLATGHVSSPGGTALDIASFLPIFRGPRAILRGVKALKAGEDVAKAAKDTSAAEEMLHSWKVDIPKTKPATIGAKARVFPVVRDPITGRPGLANPAETAADYYNLMPKGEYLYHSTSADELARIRKEGLRPGKARKNEITGVYLAEDGTSVTSLRPDNARTGDVLLRVKRGSVETEVTDMFKSGSGLEEHVSRGPVGAHNLEYLGSDNQWHPLVDRAGVSTIQKGPPPTAKTLGESVTGALKGARTTRAQQETLRSEEKTVRVKAYGKRAQEDPSLAGHLAAKSELAGKYPELNFEGFKEFSPEAFDAMSTHITDHPTLQELDKSRGKDALVKVMAGKLPMPSEEKILRKVFGDKTTGQLLRSVSVWRKLGQHGLDVANLPRAVQSSIDVSGAGRQALLMATGHPVVWAKNLGPMFKAFTSEDYYVKKMAELHQEDIVTSGVADQMGLQLSELSPKAGTSMREEPFASPLAEKIPGVRMSSRSFTYLVDKSRIDLAKILYAKAVKDAGKQIPRLRTDGKLIPKWVNEPINPEDPELLSSIGRFANSATGRGDLGHGKIGNSADVINLIFYSPRLIKSRIDFLNPVWYARLHPIARHEAYRAIAGLAGLVMFADAVAHEAGASVNLDPRSSDFAKIKVGNTRIDLAGGFNQYIRVLAETVTMQTVSQSGKTVPLAPFRAKGTAPNAQSIGAIYLRFLRNKLAPVASGTVDVGLGANTVGQPVGWNTLTSRFTPLAIQDAVSVGKDAHGLGAEIGAGLGAYGLAGFGLGVQNYKPKVPKSTGSGGSGFWDGGSSGGSGSFWGK